MNDNFDPEYIPPEDPGKKIKNVGRWFAEGFCLGVKEALKKIVREIAERTEAKPIERKVEYIPPPENKYLVKK